MSEGKIRKSTRVVKNDPTVSPILSFVLSAELGVIPDGDNPPWLTLEAIAAVVGKEAKTIKNGLSDARKYGFTVEQHPLGGYFKLAEVVEAIVHGKASEKKTGKR